VGILAQSPTLLFNLEIDPARECMFSKIRQLPSACQRNRFGHWDIQVDGGQERKLRGRNCSTCLGQKTKQQSASDGACYTEVKWSSIMQKKRKETHNCCCVGAFLSGDVSLPHHSNRTFSERRCEKTGSYYLYSYTPDQASIQTKGLEPSPCVPFQPDIRLITVWPLRCKKN